MELYKALLVRVLLQMALQCRVGSNLCVGWPAWWFNTQPDSTVVHSAIFFSLSTTGGLLSRPSLECIQTLDIHVGHAPVSIYLIRETMHELASS